MGTAQACLVRAVSMNALQTALLAGGDAALAVVRFARWIATSFLKRPAYWATEYDTSPYSSDAARKCRAWQCICVLAPRGRLTFESTAAAAEVRDTIEAMHDVAFESLMRPNRNETRQFIEVFLVHCVRMYPRALLRRCVQGVRCHFSLVVGVLKCAESDRCSVFSASLARV
jgi:hypothetical protein